MKRISIDVTPEQHQKLKALAALQGKTIKEFVLESTLGTHSEARALAELEAFLDERVRRSEVEGTTRTTVEEIFQEARNRIERERDG